MDKTPFNCLATYGNLQHTVDDLQRRNHSVVEAYLSSKDEKPKVIFIANVNNHDSVEVAVFAASRWGRNQEVDGRDVYITKEYPEASIVYVGGDENGTVYKVSRRNARQWRRGSSDQTMSFNLLSRVGTKELRPGHSAILATAFNTKPVSSQELNEALEKMLPVVILSNHVWLELGKNKMYAMYYDDIMLGMLSKDRLYFPVNESETLAEEVIHAFRLQRA